MSRTKAANIKDALTLIIGTKAGYYTTLIPDEKIVAVILVPEEPRSHWSPHGLECTISKIPDIESKGTHGGLKRIRTWTVVLNQWDRTDSTTLEEVRDLIEKTFVGRCKIKSYQPQSGLDRERCTLLINQQNYERT
jgi:hypothetical protein